MAERAKARKKQEPLGVKTTAKPRFSRYKSPVTELLECFGGAFPPFLPTKQGANMRHIRKPQPPPVEI